MCVCGFGCVYVKVGNVYNFRLCVTEIIFCCNLVCVCVCVCVCVSYSGGSCWSRGILWSLALKRDLQMECQECRHFGSVEKVEKQTNMKEESLNVLSLTLSLKVLCVRVCGVGWV